MKKTILSAVFLVVFLGLAFQNGCLFQGDKNPVATETTPPTSPDIGTAESVRFKIELPKDSKGPLANSSVRPSDRLDGSVLGNICSEVGISSTTVTFRLVLVNIGNTANPTTILSKTITVASDGSAIATFTAIPARTCVGYITISGGNVNGYSEFHGALDLVASAGNIIVVSPIGSNMTEDVIAQIVEYVVSNPKLFGKVNSNFSGSVRSQISSLDSTSDNFAQSALALFTQYLVPPVQTITPEQIMQAQQNSVNTGAAPNDPSSYWQAGETSMTNWNTDVSNFFGAGTETVSLDSLSSLPRFSIRQNVILPSQFSWRSKDGRDWMSPIRSQGVYGTCVAFACCGTMEAMMRIQGNVANPDLSEYYLFYNGNGGNAHLSEGWSFRPALEYLKTSGTVSEFVCPYSLIPNYVKPSASANLFKLTDWQFAKGTVAIKQALLQGPVVTRMLVYEDFWRFYKSGVYHYVSGPLIDGHAVIIDGWDDNQSCWICRNSWGTRWGQDEVTPGTFRIKYGQLSHYGDSFYPFSSDPDEFGWACTYVSTPEVPDVPKGISLIGNDGQVNLSWGMVTGATSYNVYWATTPGVTQSSGTKISVTAPPFIHEQLSNGTTYYYVVTAVNSAGESADSISGNATPLPPPVMASPTNVKASPENAQNVISWNTVSNATAYNLYWSNSPNFKSSTGNSQRNVSSPYHHTGLSNGTGYYYVITAVGSLGESPDSIQVNAIPILPTPTGVAVAPGDSKMTLSWDNVSGATGFNLYWANQAGVNRTIGNRISDVSSPFAHTGLINGVSYYYVVTAKDSTSQSVESSQVSGTPAGVPAPAAPTNVSATPGNGQVAISWAEVSGASSYNIYWSTSSGVSPTNGTKIGNVTSPFTQTGITNGTPYYYVVTAANSSGESSTSNQANATPNVAPAVPGSVSPNAGNGQITISWSVVSGASSYNLYWSTNNGVTPSTGTKIANVTNPYVFTGLGNGTTYYFVLTAVNSMGESGGASQVSATPQPPVPGIPAGVSATATDTAVTIAWNSVSGATGYNIYWATGSGVTPSTGTKITGASSPYKVTGLTNGTTYFFVVTATNGGGESNPSTQISAIPERPTPGVPGGVNAIATANAVTVSWTSVSGATSYNLYWSTTSGVTPSTGTKVGGVSTPYQLTGLTNGTTYYFVVTAVNGGGESAAASQVSATPQPAAPTAPTGVSGTATDTAVIVAWTSIGGATGYNIYWSTGSGVSPSTGTKIAGVSSPYKLTGLTNGTPYYFIVTAMNGGGESGASAQVSGTPQPPAPPAPTGPSATATDTAVTVAWSSVVGATGYNIYWSTGSGVTPSTGTKIAGVISPYKFTGLMNGATYYFVVTAANTGGESGASSQVSATPQPSAPTEPTGVIVTATDTAVTISWSSVAGATGYNIYWSTGSGVSPSTGSKIAGVSSPYTLAGLTNGTAYYVVVTAVNGGGESNASAQATASPLHLPVPNNVSATTGNAQTVVSWTAVSGAATYNIYWSSSPGVNKVSGNKFANVTSPYTHSGLTNGLPIYYVVTAADAGGESQESIQVTATPQNLEPVVSITTPTNNATFAAGVSIVISATATDTDGTVAKVEFYQGATKIGESTSAPYNYTWSNLPGGTHTITAKATDNQGATKMSSGNSITVKSVSISLAVGVDHLLALRSDKTVWAWGGNSFGQIGDGTNSPSPVPVKVSGLSNINSISAGDGFSVALQSGGTVWSWGKNNERQLGDESNTNSSIPVQFRRGGSPVTGEFSSISAGYNHSTSNVDHWVGAGNVCSWGSNQYYQLGWDGPINNRWYKEISNNWVDQVAAGSSFTLVKSGGNIYAWGNGIYSFITYSVPLTGVDSVAAGGNHFLAIKGGKVWAWGDNGSGQLGDGTNVSRSDPTECSSLSLVSLVTGGAAHTLALRQDGTVWAWGNNASGQLGDGSFTSRSYPVQVQGLTNITAISAKGGTSAALKNDGTIWSWGANPSGILGDGGTANRNVPAQIQW